MRDKYRVILVTDGDKVAKKAIEIAVKNIGGRCISRSGGNPTPISGDEIVTFVKQAKYDPVVIMVDDVGNDGLGKGEKALSEILLHKDIEILGVIAVASNTKNVTGIKVDFSINQNGDRVFNAVDKDGVETDSKVLFGDTVDVINSYKIPLVVGIGDVGKMKGKDNIHNGAPILTKALKEILERNECDES